VHGNRSNREQRPRVHQAEHALLTRRFDCCQKTTGSIGTLANSSVTVGHFTFTFYIQVDNFRLLGRSLVRALRTGEDLASIWQRDAVGIGGVAAVLSRKTLYGDLVSLFQ